jgi:poly(A) polymerase
MQRNEEDFQGKEYNKVYTKNFFIGLEIEKKPSE